MCASRLLPGVVWREKVGPQQGRRAGSFPCCPCGRSLCPPERPLAGGVHLWTAHVAPEAGPGHVPSSGSRSTQATSASPSGKRRAMPVITEVSNLHEELIQKLGCFKYP